MGKLGYNATQPWIGDGFSSEVRSKSCAARDAGDDRRVAPTSLTSTNEGSSTIHRPYHRSYGTKNPESEQL